MEKGLQAAPGLVSKQVQYLQLSPLLLTTFFTLEFVGMSLTWIQAHVLFEFEVLQTLFSFYFKILFFLVKAFFYMQVPIGILVWFGDQSVSMEAGWDAFGPLISILKVNSLIWNMTTDLF